MSSKSFTLSTVSVGSPPSTDDSERVTSQTVTRRSPPPTASLYVPAGTVTGEKASAIT